MNPSFHRVNRCLFSALSLVLCGLVGGCQHIGTENTPVEELAIDSPERWSEAGRGSDGRISSGWVKTFRDSKMNSLVAEAMRGNRNLQIAAARLRQAHEDTVATRVQRLPSVGFRGNASRTRDENGPGVDAELRTSTGLGLDASWELDLWGRLRNLDKAGQLDFAGARADFRAARLSLAANTAKAWFDLIAAEQQVRLAEQTRDSFVRNHRITERNYKAGDQTTSPLSVQLGRTNIASAERSLVRARLERDEAARSLEVLIGRYPDAEILAVADLPSLPREIPTGLPSDLLLRRPDVVAAIVALEASAERAKAARKNLLPSLNLNGGPGSSGSTLSRVLVDPEYFVWSIAGSLAQSVYDGGAPTAAARRALASNEVAVRTLADTALNAFREVESALAIGRSLAEQEVFLETETSQAKLAEEQAARDYSEGLVDIISLLEAQRRAASARTSLISIRAQRLRNRVDLHLALGGDFETLPDNPKTTNVL